MKIKTDYKGCSYITAGKEYNVLSFTGDSNGSVCGFLDDKGDIISVCVGRPSSHLGDIGTWELMDSTNED